MNCPHCAAPLKKVGDYIPPTCGKSECQEAAYRANKAQYAPKKRKLQPKEGALKADGTRWTKQPGGIEKLEIRNGPDDPWFNTELQFARLIFAFMELQSVDSGQWTITLEELGKMLGYNESQVTSIFMRASDTLRKAGYRE